MKKLLLIISILFSMHASAQWTGAIMDTLTNNNIADEVNRHCMVIADDNIHIVFKRANPVQAWDLYYMMRDSSGMWTTEFALPCPRGNNPAICTGVNPADALITYQSTDTVDGDEEVWLGKDSAGAWTFQQITSDTTDDYMPVIAIDQSGYVHLAWVGIDTTSNYEIKYATNLSGSWAFQTITISDPGPFGSGATPELAVEPNGIAHINYRAGNSGIYKIDHLYNQTPGGTAWMVDHISTTNAEDYQSSMIITDDTVVNVLINGNGGFGFPWESFYQKKEGSSATFVPVQQVAAGRSGVLGNMFIDGDGIAYFIFNEVSGNIYTGNVLYADSNNWGGTNLTNTINILEANIVVDEAGNAYMLAYRGDFNAVEEIVFYGPQSGVGLKPISKNPEPFYVYGSANSLNIKIQNNFEGKITCYSIEGKIVFESQRKFVEGEIVVVKDLSAGTYVVSMVNGTSVSTLRIVVGE